MTKYKILIFAALFVFTQKIIAQPGNNKVVIQGKFIPSLGDAKKINLLPTVEDTVYKSPNFKYSIQEKKIETPFKISPIKAAKLQGEPLSKLYSNYLALGLGNNLTPYLDYYHSSLRSRDFKYGVHVNHFSSAGTIKGYYPSSWSNNLIELYATKLYKDFAIDAGITYKRNVTHFYGFKTDTIKDVDLIKESDLVQCYNYIDANARIYKYNVNNADINYDFKIDYYHLQDHYLNSEDNISIKGKVDKDIDLVNDFTKQRLGIDLEEEYYGNKWNTNLNSGGSNLFKLNPFYSFNYYALTAKVSLGLQMTSDLSTYASLFPNINLGYKFIPDVLYGYFNITSKETRTSLKTLSDENPFISTPITLSFTKLKYKINTGLSSSVSKDVNLGFELNYSKLENAPLFIIDTNSIYKNKFTTLYESYKVFNLKIQSIYQQSERLKLMLIANYYHYNTINELYAWYKPQYDIKLSANYNMQNKIYFKAALISYGSMKAKAWENNTVVIQNINPWLDLNLGVEYRYRENTGLFININNLTASRYSRWYNYPSYRLNVIAGMNFIF